MKRIILILMAILLITIPAASILARDVSSDVVIDETILEPKDPLLGTVIAIGPGLLAHGWGHFYAEDYRMGLTLFGIEIASLIPIGIGLLEYNNPSSFTGVGGNNDTVKRGGIITMAVGGIFFILTWVVDISLAGKAAEQYNKEHNLEFKVQQESFLNGKSDSVYAALYNFKF